MPASCVVPPGVLQRIARNGTARQREWALATLAVDTSVRTSRAVRSARHAVAAPFLAAELGDEPQRSVYDARGTERLPGRVVRQEGDPESADAAVNEAYAGLGATFELYLEAYERRSIDDEGMPLRATVHYGDHYDNAFWNGAQMVFGDGDGELFQRFTRSLDVVGHELTHGVTEHELGLEYLGQPGALNESLSDVFGSLVKQYHLGQSADQADWLIGAELLMPAVHGVALRSLKAPGTAYDDPVLGKDEQPATMAGYVHSTADNGAVHINSGIPNHAFYLAATSIGGPAWEVAGRVWYEALRDDRLGRATRFRTFARATLRAAHGFGQHVVTAVTDAWRAVEVLP